MSDVAAGHDRDPLNEYERTIEPLLFPPVDGDASPRLTLIAGGPGSGRGRAIARALDASPTATVLSSTELRALHAAVAETGASSTASVNADVAEWLRAAISRAREVRRSLIIEGDFRTPVAALGVAKQFLDAGYQVQTVVVVPRRAESLLAVASAHYRQIQRTGDAVEVSVADHDVRWTDVRDVLAAVSTEPGLEVTVLDGSGNELPVDSSDAFNRARAGGPTKRAAVEWLGELRRITDFARSLPPRTTHLDLLIELHQAALRQVVPAMDLPPNSTTGPQLESRLAAEAQSLRRQRAALPTSEPATVSEPAPEFPAIGG